MPLLERATGTRRVGLLSLVGLVLLPLLVAGGFLWATWGSTTRLDRVQAAVVNLDEPVTVQGRLVPLGRQLAGGLVAGNADQNFDWVLTDAEDAGHGLTSGAYAAVVTIPKTFSARATSFSKTDPADMRAATIDVQTSSQSGIADPVVSQAITAAATKALNSSLTRQYLQNIYVGFNKLGTQFGTVAGASAKLTDGTTKVADGLDGIDSGTAALASGLDQLGTGAGQLAKGAAQTSTGTAALAKGLDQLADGTKALPGGARKLAKGTRASADGAGRLADGADRLAGGVGKLRAGTKANAAGVRQFAGGLQQYRDTFRGIAALGDAQLVQRFPQLCPAPATLEQCAPVLQGFRGGITATLAGFENTKDASGATVPGLIPSATRLATGAAGIDRGVAGISTGASGLAGGTAKLAGGLDELADGSSAFADGVGPLAKGIRSSATGAGKLADGVSELSTATTQLATGTQQSAAGAHKLADGTDKLTTATHQLADGSQKLSDGLAKGAKAVPTYDKATRQKLSSVVTTPVSTGTPTSVFSDVTTTTFLAVLALWLGALASYLVLRAVSSRVLSSMKPSWRLSVEGLAPAALIGAVQAVALTVVLQLLLHLPAGRVAALAAFALLTATAFVAVNHALVAWFGGVGRFASVALVVVGAAGAVTSAVPASFDALRPFLPLTPALDGFRAITGGTSGAGAAAALLVAWLLLGLVAGVLAVTRRRVLAPLVSPLPA